MKKKWVISAVLAAIVILFIFISLLPGDRPIGYIIQSQESGSPGASSDSPEELDENQDAPETIIPPSEETPETPREPGGAEGGGPSGGGPAENCVHIQRQGNSEIERVVLNSGCDNPKPSCGNDNRCKTCNNVQECIKTTTITNKTSGHFVEYYEIEWGSITGSYDGKTNFCQITDGKTENYYTTRQKCQDFLFRLIACETEGKYAGQCTLE